MAAFEPQDDGNWRRVKDDRPIAGPDVLRPCRNYAVANVCNWMVPTDDPHEFCASCRFTQIIPALNKPENREHWFRLERAKRRLIYSLRGLRLPLRTREEDPHHGLAFQFLEDVPSGERVLTGHSEGIITLNVAEADDAYREKTRHAMHEPYRTLLGHFRHEVGHYYWDLLVDHTPRIHRFRELFGDERADYGAALRRLYDEGPLANWETRFISAYASVHPWEDWAETWAHYLHMTDGLHSAEHWGFALMPLEADQSPLDVVDIRQRARNFDTLLFKQWMPLTLFLNALNRSLGHPDAYPFSVAPPVVEKLRFIDEIIREVGPDGSSGPPPSSMYHASSNFVADNMAQKAG